MTGVVSFFPALSDLSGYEKGRAGGWPHLFRDSTDAVEIRKKKLEVSSYYDVANLAQKIKVPGFYSYGYNDNTCPPTTVTAALNVITAPKTIVVTPVSAHWRFEETNRKSIEWMKKRIN